MLAGATLWGPHTKAVGVGAVTSLSARADLGLHPRVFLCCGNRSLFYPSQNLQMAVSLGFTIY